MASTQINLYEAKTQLSSLVERAAKGEEFVIAKAGKPMARLTTIFAKGETVEPEWEKDLPLELFENEEEDELLFPGGAK